MQLKGLDDEYIFGEKDIKGIIKLFEQKPSLATINFLR